VVLVQLFLAAGANIHAEDFGGNTALSIAIQASHYGLVNILLKSGADVNTFYPDWSTSIAQRLRLLYNGMAATPLTWAMQNRGNESIVQLLLDSGADPNVVNEQGDAVLCEAVDGYRDDRLSMVPMLLKAGANVNAHSGTYGSALIRAINSTNEIDLEVVRMLLDAGAATDVVFQAQYGTCTSAITAAISLVIFVMADRRIYHKKK